MLINRSTQAWSISSRYSAESKSAISAALRWPSIKFTASKLMSAKLGLVARPSESLAKRASCAASHLASSALTPSKAEASRGRRVRRLGPEGLGLRDVINDCLSLGGQPAPLRLVTQLLLVVNASK